MEPRFQHWVVTAPIYDAPESWGLAASRNVKGFMEAVWKVINRMYPGGGLGAHMSYQDHGEAGLARRHPHVDLTVNGWRILDDKMVPLPDHGHGSVVNWTEGLDGGPTYPELVRIVEEEAQALHLGASASSVYVGDPLDGFARYHKILGYQVREMIDLRKMRYDRAQQLVGWQSYKPPHEVTWTPRPEWDAAFAEYCARLGTFDGNAKRKLHRHYGHMASGQIRRKQLLTGGKNQMHPEGCNCNRCEDWRRVFAEAGATEDWHALATPYDA